MMAIQIATKQKDTKEEQKSPFKNQDLYRKIKMTTKIKR